MAALRAASNMELELDRFLWGCKRLQKDYNKYSIYYNIVCYSFYVRLAGNTTILKFFRIFLIILQFNHLFKCLLDKLGEFWSYRIGN